MVAVPGRQGTMAAATSTAATSSKRADAAGSTKRQDPLALLREFTLREKKVQWSEHDYLDFDGQKVHRYAKCAYRLSPSEPFLDIGSVWYMFREISGDRPYTQESTRKRGFKYISVANRGDLCDWLVGNTEIESVPGIVKDVFEGRKRPRDDTYGDSGRNAKQTKSANFADEPSELPGLGGRLKLGEITYADVLDRVRPVQDLNVLVRRPGRTVPNADLILKIAQEEVNSAGRWLDRRETPRSQGPLGKIPLLKELENMFDKDKSARPIILVPCNKNSPVNILNAGKFLQDGEYYPPDAEKSLFFESARPESVEVVRNVHGKVWTFEVRDVTKHFTKSQWLRVVAVITDGTEWQVKSWPFETIVDLFTSVRGVFFLPVGQLCPEHVKEWKVAILEMSPTAFQHRYGAIRDRFWEEVENFLMEYRTKKFVNHTTLQPTKGIIIKPVPIL